MAKKKKKTEITEQSIKELQVSAMTLDREIFALRNELSLHRKLEKPHLLKSKRKDKARVLTQLTVKQKSTAASKEA